MCNSNETQNCVICADTLKKPVTCEYCNQIACINCWRMYFKIVPSRNPKCIFDNCKQEWNSILMYKYLGLQFMKKEYKEIKQNILFQHEESQIPDTLKYLPNYRSNVKINENITKLQKKISGLEHDLKEKRSEYINLNYIIKQRQGEFIELSLQILNTINLLERQILEYKNEIKKEKSRKTPTLLDVNIQHDEQGNGYKFHCPKNGCNGYIYSNSGNSKNETNCIVCNELICKQCESLVKKDDKGEYIKHKCDSNILSNVLLLKNDTKGCPKCNTLIYKISGCDQMYCTKCKCCFSWNTGEIDNTSIHNPHYFNELRQNEQGRGRGVVDGIIRCQERIIDTLTVSQIIKKIQEMKYNESTIGYLFSIVQQMSELKSKITKDQVIQQDLDQEATKLRISFVCNEITKKQFCQKIYLRDLDLIKKNEFSYLFNLYLTILDDYLKRLLYKEITISQFKSDINEAKDVINKNLKELSSIFGIKKVECV